METFLEKEEKSRVAKITEVIESLDPKVQEAFTNILIGYGLAINLEPEKLKLLLESKVEKASH